MPFKSKTIVGLVLILVLATVLNLTGHLSPEMVDVLKWVGGSFMAVRSVANYAENKYSG